jgi:hypothetical protein
MPRGSTRAEDGARAVGDPQARVIVAAEHHDPFGFLGMHTDGEALVVRIFAGGGSSNSSIADPARSSPRARA